MADASRVSCCPHIHPGSRASRTVSGDQIAVLAVLEVGQLVKSNKIIATALVLLLVLAVLHGANIDPRSGGKNQAVVCGVIPGSPIRIRIQLHGPADDVLELWERLTQDNRPIMWDMHLAQGFHDQIVAFSPA